MTLTMMFLTSLSLGLIHGFDPDHVMIVTNFVSQNPRPRKAILFGLNFGLGHSLAVLTFSFIALGLKLLIPNQIITILESLAGAVLIILGVWVIWGVIKRTRDKKQQQKIHGHSHNHGIVAHEHPHSHTFQHEHQHQENIKHRGAMLTGVITGLAGTASVMLFGPVLMAPNLIWSAFFIAVYGLGVIFSMSVYGYLVSKFYLFAKRSKVISEIIIASTGALSIALGILWASGVL